MRFPISKSLLISLCFLVLNGCVRGKKEMEVEEEPTLAGLTIREPSSEDEWRVVRNVQAQVHLCTKDEEYDEDLIGIFAELVPLPRSMNGELDLFNFINQSELAHGGSFQLDELMGRNVVRFELVDEGAENPRTLTSVYNLKPRPRDVPYTKRTKGILVLHPHNDRLAIRIGVWRNSYHGRIGQHFESVAEDFASSLLASNRMVGQFTDTPPSSGNRGGRVPGSQSKKKAVTPIPQRPYPIQLAPVPKVPTLEEIRATTPTADEVKVEELPPEGASTPVGQ